MYTVLPKPPPSARMILLLLLSPRYLTRLTQRQRQLHQDTLGRSQPSTRWMISESSPAPPQAHPDRAQRGVAPNPCVTSPAHRRIRRRPRCLETPALTKGWYCICPASAPSTYSMSLDQGTMSSADTLPCLPTVPSALLRASEITHSSTKIPLRFLSDSYSTTVVLHTARAFLQEHHPMVQYKAVEPALTHQRGFYIVPTRHIIHTSSSDRVRISLISPLTCSTHPFVFYFSTTCSPRFSKPARRPNSSLLVFLSRARNGAPSNS